MHGGSWADVGGGSQASLPRVSHHHRLTSRNRFSVSGCSKQPGKLVKSLSNPNSKEPHHDPSALPGDPTQLLSRSRRLPGLLESCLEQGPSQGAQRSPLHRRSRLGRRGSFRMTAPLPHPAQEARRHPASWSSSFLQLSLSQRFLLPHFSQSPPPPPPMSPGQGMASERLGAQHRACPHGCPLSASCLEEASVPPVPTGHLPQPPNLQAGRWGTAPALQATSSSHLRLSGGRGGFFPLSCILTALSSFSQRV